MGHLVQPSCQSRVTYSRLHRTLSRLICFLFDSRNYEQNCFLLRKSSNSSEYQNKATFPQTGSACCATPWLEAIKYCTTWASQHLKGHRIIYTILFFFIELTSINSILRDTLKSLSAFLAGILTNQHLLLQNIMPLKSKCMQTLCNSLALLNNLEILYEPLIFFSSDWRREAN